MLGAQFIYFLPTPRKEHKNIELKSGMTKPEEFDSSVLRLAEVLVIRADGGGGPELEERGGLLGQSRVGEGVGRGPESGPGFGKEGVLRPAGPVQSFMNKHSNWGHHR